MAMGIFGVIGTPRYMTISALVPTTSPNTILENGWVTCIVFFLRKINAYFWVNSVFHVFMRTHFYRRLLLRTQ